MRTLLAFAVLASPAFAETALTGDEFEALVTGKTLTFTVNDIPYGSEYYAPDRRVIWAFEGDNCKSGEWYEAQTNDGPAICFEYEDDDTPKCWQIFSEGDSFRANYLNRPSSAVLHQATEQEPLVCGGVGA